MLGTTPIMKREVAVRPNPFTLANTEISKEIIGIHDSSLAARYDVLSLYDILVNLIKNSTRIGDSLQQKIKGFRSVEIVEDKIPQSSIMPPAHNLKEIACKMISNSFNAHAAHETVVWILDKLRNYSWDAKAVIALAAFTMEYGEPWRLSAVQHTTESSVLEVHLFKFGGEDKSRQAYIEQFKTLLDPTLQLIRGIIGLEDLINDKTYSRKEVPTLYTVQRETYTYWAIFALLACAVGITESEWSIKTSEIVRKVNLELTNLNIILKECKAQIDAMKDYKWRLSVFHNPSGVLTFLKALIYPRDHSPMEIFDNYKKAVVPLDVLKSRHLLLFISPLDNIEDEIWALKPINDAFRRDPDKQDYSILWVPVVENWNEENKAKYEYLKSQMPWYVISYFSLIKGIRPLREELFYQDMPIVVVVNPRGEIINKNAMHMIFPWGIKAFPFHPDVDKRLSGQWNWLWNEVVTLNPIIDRWIKENNFVFIYDPSDTPLPRNIEAPLHTIRREWDPATNKNADFSIQYYNVKKSENYEKFWKNITNLFMTKITKPNAEEDPSLKEVEKLLTLKDPGWVLLSKGRNVLVLDNMNIMSSVLLEYDTWRSDIVRKLGFDNAYLDYYNLKRSQTHWDCSHLSLSNLRSGEIPLNVYCPEAACPLKMEIASINYKCCHGEHYKHGAEGAADINVKVPVLK
ncbi:hypothetical protein L6164_012841 [Bauhinia variegata]|uniref:Uncharacterized protein n=1 Tax=Bauhinia variegata TaxID=167791 RepID=A0ACB9PB78_BAUVA|nr:hypothetical protein L6164_012841 [Bauhinia variegata]